MLFNQNLSASYATPTPLSAFFKLGTFPTLPVRQENPFPVWPRRQPGLHNEELAVVILPSRCS